MFSQALNKVCAISHISAIHFGVHFEVVRWTRWEVIAESGSSSHPGKSKRGYAAGMNRLAYKQGMAAHLAAWGENLF
jgi:hypothetical protein